MGCLSIGLLSHEYPPFDGGGIGTYARTIAPLLAGHGHEVHVLTNLWPGEGLAEHTSEPIGGGTLHVHRIAAIDRSWGPHPDLGWVEERVHRDWSPYLVYAERLADLAERVHTRHGLDILEYPECAAEGWAIAERRRLGAGFEDLPLTVTLHSPIEDIYRHNRYPRQNAGFQRRRALEDASIEAADAVNAPSASLLRTVGDRLGLGLERVMDVVRLPMPASSATGTPADNRSTLCLLAVGRVEPRKGLVRFVDAAAGLLERFPNFTVELVGADCDAGDRPGTMSEMLRSRWPSEHGHRLVFHGPRPHAELSRLYANALGCVFASDWDNYPVSCLEAMEAGCCCIVSDGVGSSEILTDGTDGLVFTAGDYSELREKLAWLLDDPSRADAIGRRARERVAEIAGADSTVDARLTHYRSVIDHAAAGPRTSAATGPARVGWRPTGIGTTDDTVRHAADRAGVSLVGTDGSEAVDGDLIVAPGDAIAENALEELVALLRRHPDAGWVSCWTEPHSRAAPIDVGPSFRLPLDLMLPRQPRVVLARAGVLPNGGHAGSWPGWIGVCLGVWDSGKKGEVLPRWLSRTTDDSVPTGGRSDTARTRGRTALALEDTARRHPVVFERFGGELWAFQHAALIPSDPSETALSGGRWATLKAAGWALSPGLFRVLKRARDAAWPTRTR